MKEPTKGLAVLRWTFDFFKFKKKKKTPKAIYNNWVFDFSILGIWEIFLGDNNHDYQL